MPDRWIERTCPACGVESILRIPMRIPKGTAAVRCPDCEQILWRTRRKCRHSRRHTTLKAQTQSGRGFQPLLYREGEVLEVNLSPSLVVMAEAQSGRGFQPSGGMTTFLTTPRPRRVVGRNPNIQGVGGTDHA
jgi:predicted RNA-binding Zn-ribbon protein involved in translation (DUF1610 family)